LTTTNYLHVAIDHDTAILGFPGDDADLSGPGRGSAYLFVRNGATWVQQKKLTASDGKPGDSFGFSVAISGDTTIIAAAGATVDGHVSQGSAYIFLRSPDTDGDGLPDDWEKNGVTIDGEFIDLKAMGADPMHKDIFVHVDWMQQNPSQTDYDFRPNPIAIRMVIDSFAVAPVDNPDGKQGINLHVDFGLSVPKTRFGSQGCERARSNSTVFLMVVKRWPSLSPWRQHDSSTFKYSARSSNQHSTSESSY
jgi:hypothetical protein